MAILLPAPHPHPANKHLHTCALLHGALLLGAPIHVRQSMVCNSSVRYSSVRDSTVRYVAGRIHFILLAGATLEHQNALFMLKRRGKWDRKA